MKTFILLIATTFVAQGALAGPRNADLHNCARALADHGSKLKVGIAKLSRRTLFIPIGRQFVLLNPEEMNCHPLVNPTVEHAAGSEIETYSFRMPKAKIEFSYIIQRDNETRRLTSSKIARLEDGDNEPVTLRSHSCLDPEGREYKLLIKKLVRAIDRQTEALKEERSTRADIRRHSGDEPGPAFPPASEMSLDENALKSCQAIDNKELKDALERHDHALSRINWNELLRGKKTSRSGSVN